MPGTTWPSWPRTSTPRGPNSCWPGSKRSSGPRRALDAMAARPIHRATAHGRRGAPRGAAVLGDPPTLPGFGIHARFELRRVVGRPLHGRGRAEDDGLAGDLLVLHRRL